MNSVDIAILAIMGISCLTGIMRGFTREILGLFTWIGSAFAAYLTHPLATEYARQHISNPMIADGLSAVVLFIVFLILFSIITYNISSSIKGSFVSSIDRGLGLAFGVIRGSVIICSAEIAFSLFFPREIQSESIKSARFVPMTQRGADELLLMLPANWRNMLDQQSKNLQNATKTAVPAAQLLTPIIASPAPTDTTPAQQGAQDTQPNPQNETLAQQPSLGSTPLPKTSPRQVTPLDRDKAADSLSDLKPMAADIKGKEGTYDTRQQRELDRLIDTSE